MKSVLNLIIVTNSVMCDEQSISSHSDDSAIGWGVTTALLHLRRVSLSSRFSDLSLLF
ncbi:hypothetical protein Hanom_Chr08g00732071 [Helianthus anomalus]